MIIRKLKTYENLKEKEIDSTDLMRRTAFYEEIVETESGRTFHSDLEFYVPDFTDLHQYDEVSNILENAKNITAPALFLDGKFIPFADVTTALESVTSLDSIYLITSSSCIKIDGISNLEDLRLIVSTILESVEQAEGTCVLHRNLVKLTKTIVLTFKDGALDFFRIFDRERCSAIGVISYLASEQKRIGCKTVVSHVYATLDGVTVYPFELTKLIDFGFNNDEDSHSHFMDLNFFGEIAEFPYSCSCSFLQYLGTYDLDSLESFFKMDELQSAPLHLLRYLEENPGFTYKLTHYTGDGPRELELNQDSDVVYETHAFWGEMVQKHFCSIEKQNSRTGLKTITPIKTYNRSFYLGRDLIKPDLSTVFPGIFLQFKYSDNHLERHFYSFYDREFFFSNYEKYVKRLKQDHYNFIESSLTVEVVTRVGALMKETIHSDAISSAKLAQQQIFLDSLFDAYFNTANNGTTCVTVQDVKYTSEDLDSKFVYVASYFQGELYNFNLVLRFSKVQTEACKHWFSAELTLPEVPVRKVEVSNGLTVTYLTRKLLVRFRHYFGKQGFSFTCFDVDGTSFETSSCIEAYDFLVK